jgi:hypothetical protein
MCTSWTGQGRESVCSELLPFAPKQGGDVKSSLGSYRLRGLCSLERCRAPVKRIALTSLGFNQKFGAKLAFMTSGESADRP